MPSIHSASSYRLMLPGRSAAFFCLLVSVPTVAAGCGGEGEPGSDLDDTVQPDSINREGGLVAVDSDGNEFRGAELAKLLSQQLEEKASYGSGSDMTANSSTATIPDGLGAPTETPADLNCLFQGSGEQCWLPGYNTKAAVEVCFHPDNQDWFDDVVRDVLNIGSGSFFGGYSFVEADSWFDPNCELVAEEKFELANAYGEAPVVYLNTTEYQTCGPGGANFCLFYGRAAFRIWTQRIDADQPGFPGDPFMAVLKRTIHHEVGHVLGLQHNELFDPAWGHNSFMRRLYSGGFESYFGCELQKLSNYLFSNGGSTLTRYSATDDTANCTDD